LNTHPVPEIEAAHQAFTSKVPVQDQIALLVQLQATGSPNKATLHRISEAMGVSPEQAASRLEMVSFGLNQQYEAAARAVGVDPKAAGAWIGQHRRDTAMSVLQAHAMRRDVRAWLPLLRDAKAALGDKR
jgi:hypothetical protein